MKNPGLGILAGALWAALILVPLTAGAAGTEATAQPAQPPTVAQVEQYLQGVNGAVFPVGSYNAAYADDFTGDSFLAVLSQDKDILAANVTFVKGAHTYWHKHHGSCQILLGASGSGYYQIWGQDPVRLRPGESVTIPENVKHWHGAAPGSMFQHVSVMKAGASTEWLEPVDQQVFAALEK